MRSDHMSDRNPNDELQCERDLQRSIVSSCNIWFLYKTIFILYIWGEYVEYKKGTAICYSK